MNEINRVIELTREVIDMTDTEEYNEVRHVGNYYRLLIDNNAQLFTSGSSSSVQDYLDREAHDNIISISEETGYRTVRDIVEFFREWSYINGFRKRKAKSQELDVGIYSTDSNQHIVEEVNQKVRSSSLTAQDAYLGLQLAQLGMRLVESDQYDTTNEYLSILEDVSQEIDSYLDTSRKSTEWDFSWNNFGRSMEYTYEVLEKECIREEVRNKYENTGEQER